MTDKPTNDVRRIDSAGRDVTDLPGLWGEEDAFVAPVHVAVMRAVCEKWRENQADISRGKGTWPNPDYVPDAIWDGWIAVQSCLQSILMKAGIDPYEDELPA